MKIAVTGLSGFVGKNINEYLKNDFLLKDLNRESLKSISSNKITDCYGLIHLAGKAHDLKKVTEPMEYYNVNYHLTKTLFDAFLTSDSSKFIYVSSVKAVADSLNIPLTESHSANPITDYGKSKRMAEEYILKSEIPANKSVFILRPCMIHGQGNKGNLNLLFNFVKKSIPYPLAAFHNKRSFLSVENLCFVIKEIILRDDIPSGIYNVSDDEALSTTELIELLSKAIGKKARLYKVPVWLIKSIAKIGDYLSLPINSERLTKLTENYIVNNEKLKLVIGKPFPLAAKEGILQTANSFKDGK